MHKLPPDRILFYVSLFNVAETATDDDIRDAFPEAHIHNIFPMEGVAGGIDLQFKDRNEVIKAIDCREETIKGEKYTMELSWLIRQAP